MEITIERDEKDRRAYTITLGGSGGGGGDRTTIQTTWANEREAEVTVRQWVNKITKLYSSKKKKQIRNRRPLRRSEHQLRQWRHLPIIKDPFEILQICVARHCLVYELPNPTYRERNPVSRSLRDLLFDNQMVVVEVGVGKVAEKLEEYGVTVGRAVELRRLAAAAGGGGGGMSAERLAKVVLGEDWGAVKPARMEWWGYVWKESLSDDKIKYSIVDAFLAHQMGSKLLKDERSVLA